ncbi:TBC1 domain family member 12 isoform X1 [Silurus meridionalis]|uniref:TBC1 domain family member 12 isoform X1 n=1 Tax=Silurus meridionalis TaxID=175797 RepID=UPI001EEC2564|nr:TBC1 domain family member 12 isoform X1 [Silurus meridionalis]
MVASAEGRPTPSAAHVKDNKLEMDGPDPQEDNFRHGDGNDRRPTREESAQDRTVPLYTGTANPHAAIKLPNGHVSCGCDARDSFQNCSCPASGELLANGALVSDADAASSSAPSTSSASRPQSGHVSPGDDVDEDQPGALRSGRRSSSSSSEAVNRTRDSETASNDCISEAEPCSSQTLSSPDDSESSPNPAFVDVNLSSRNTYEISRRQSAPDNVVDVAEPALRQKKHVISEIFGRRTLLACVFVRGLFSRKQKESTSAPGWKLFGKVPLRESPPKDCKTIQQENNPGSLTSVSTPNLLSTGEYEAKAANSPSQPSQGRRKNLEFEPLSTTALILEDRPANLPAKPEEEAQRHRQEYDEMVAEAKKREMKEAQKKKQQMKERFKQEDSIVNAMVVWNTEVLPNWDSMRGTRRVKDLWWQGLPPNVRGKVWSLAIGNELNITPELYEIFLSRAKERWKSFRETGSEVEAEESGASLADRESSLDLIKLDISRTFPSLFIFQKGGPYHDLLHSVLGAYTCYRPDVGYVQGMSFIAAVLILNLDEADAFIAFANLLNKPCQMAFFRVDHELMLKYFAAFEVFFEENLPRLFSHFQSSNLTPDLYLIDWIFTLYSKSLPLDVACRVWDVFCRDGEEFLFRTALGILRLYEDVLLHMDFIHMAQFLTRLPEQVPTERLFSAILNTHMTSSNRKWSQVFSALMKDKESDKSGSPTLKSS